MTQFGMPTPYFPPAPMIGLAAKLYEDLGLDFTLACDQLNFLIPRSIYTPDIIPALAKGRAFDLDAWFDPYLVMGAAAAATERLGLCITTEGIRRPPSIMAQMILSLDHLSSGRFFATIGAGEIKQFTPYGQSREKPFTHLEECLRLIHEFITRTDLISRDGQIWNVRNAIMRLEPYDPVRPPKIVVLGGPGKIVEIAERGIREGFVDGWATWFPPCGAPDWYAETIAALRAAAESADRDPDELIFWCGMSSVIFADESEREYHTSNLALRLHSAIEVPGAGPTFARWGIDPPLGEDFFYSRDWIPMDVSREEAIRIAEAVPPEIVAHAKFTGTPAQVADQIWPYVDAGATHVLLGNFVDLLESGDFGDAIDRQMLVMNTINFLKERQATGVGARQ